MNKQNEQHQGLFMEGVCKSFGAVMALKNVSFEVNPGEIHALIGQNGAGKSTLMGILSGSLTADEGDIYIEGKKVDNTTIRANKDLAIVRQEFSLCPNLTVSENIFLGCEPINKFGVVDFKRMCQIAIDILERVNVPLDPDGIVDNLSVSEWQVVEICKALAKNPKFIILDEPTAALGDDRIKDLLDILIRLRNIGHGLVYISHKLPEILTVADRVTVMRDGSVHSTLKTENLTENDLVKEMIGEIELVPQKSTSKPDYGEPLVSVHGLSKKDKFHDISFTLSQGEILGIAGILGSGAADLMRSLFGIQPADKGYIVINDQQVNVTSAQQAIKAGIGYVPSDRKREGLVLPLSVYDNCSMAIIDLLGGLGHYSHSQKREITHDLIKRLNIKVASSSSAVAHLSGGNQQKVSIAKWLAKKSAVLMFEEPTRGIDIHAKAQVWKIIKELAQQKIGIIVVSNELPELIDGCDRILVMRKGEVVDDIASDHFDENKISVQLSA